MTKGFAAPFVRSNAALSRGTRPSVAGTGPAQVEHRRPPAPGVTTRMCLCDQMRKAGLRNR